MNKNSNIVGKSQTAFDPKILDQLHYSPIFPTFSCSLKLDLPVKDMKEEILSLAGDQKNYEGGFTTFYERQNLDNITGIKQLKEIIYNTGSFIAREFKYKCNYERCSINLWANVMRKGDYHSSHNHPRSTFSGTFYVECNNEMSSFVFLNPTLDFRNHDPIVMPEDINLFTAESILVKPEIGQMNIWPSWIHHYVPEMTVDGPRISISFNIDFLPLGL
jgi:uncharacterized protein (TIGR02466 family)